MPSKYFNIIRQLIFLHLCNTSLLGVIPLTVFYNVCVHIPFVVSLSYGCGQKKWVVKKKH